MVKSSKQIIVELEKGFKLEAMGKHNLQENINLQGLIKHVLH